MFCISNIEYVFDQMQYYQSCCRNVAEIRDGRYEKECEAGGYRQMFPNKYLDAKINVDTAKNEPLKVCQKLAKS